MKLSQEMIQKLSDLAENKVRIVVKGKNSIGQDFESDGFIMPGFASTTGRGKDKVPSFIIEKGFAMNMGQKALNSKGEEYNLFLSIYVDADDNNIYDENLYAQTISEKESGKQIFVNEDFEQLMERSLAAWSEEHMNYKLREPIEGDALELLKLVGKPIVNLGVTSGSVDERGVLKSVNLTKGLPYANITTGYMYIGIPMFDFKQIVLDSEALTNLDEYADENAKPETEPNKE